MAAASTGDIQSLMDVLAPDVVLVTDGGGVKKAALRPILGRDKVVRFLDARRPSGPAEAGRRRSSTGRRRCGSSSTASSTPSLDRWSRTAWSPALYAVRNPAKLARLDVVTDLAR